MGGLLTSVFKNLAFRLLLKSGQAVVFVPFVLFHAVRNGFVPVKDRHVYTRSGRLRLRYVALIAAAFMGLAASNLSFRPQHGFEIAEAQAGIADIPVTVASAQMATQATFAAPVAPAKPVLAKPANYSRTVTIKSGDTLSDVLHYTAMASDDAVGAIKALKDHINPKELKAGQNVTMHYTWNASQGERWTAMEFTPTPLTRVVLRQGAGGAFKVDKQQVPLKQATQAARFKITSSLYGDMHRAGVPDSIIAEFIKAYSYSVDFARDIWDGDSVELLYDVSRTDDGGFVKGEQLLYASLTMRGKPNVIVRFNNNGQSEYYDGKGEPIKKALLRTPVDGARVTSGFGMRRHPIQGYTKMHKGIDFGAPTGTPIFAAGDGVVTRANWFSGFGKYVSIKHNGTYSTAYGHMSQIAVKPGQRVRQGQVIGRVGTTGNSTGPHLHFEVLKNGGQINPVKLANLSIGNKLGGKQLARFQLAVASAKGAITQYLNGAKAQQASFETSSR